MEILITGASSYVGARIYSDLGNKFDVRGTYLKNKLFQELEQLDITKKESVDKIIGILKPDVIIHAAAIPSASWCEKNPDLAKQINIQGTKNVINAAKDIGAKIIYISSFAAINPSSLYGKTKLDSEEYVKQSGLDFVIFRPCLIIGQSPNTTNDRPHNRLLKNITEKTRPVYDTSWKFQPTWLGHLSECIDSVIEKGIKNEIIPLAVPELKSRYDIAKDILLKFNIKAIPEGKKKNQIPILREELSKLTDLNLPQYSYKKIIIEVVNEIKDYLKTR
ncbi:MAG: sugar nucleotide-binding protein [Nanoarchaeota archaeon]|nr:sugar nucleotide-binding protein [Nanoarchaeota archaeon]